MAEGLFSRVFGLLAERDLHNSMSARLGVERIERMLIALEENGYSPVTDTWRPGGAMTPIGADELRVGIGSGILFELTSEFALAPDEVTGLLAEHLPPIVRHLRASGAIKCRNAVDRRAG